MTTNDERLDRLERAVSDLATMGIRAGATADRLALVVDRLATTVDRLAFTVDGVAATVDRLAGHVDRLVLVTADHIENHRNDQ